MIDLYKNFSPVRKQWPDEPWVFTGQVPCDWFDENCDRFLFTEEDIQCSAVSIEDNQPPHKSGIYFLLQAFTIVYIGQSYSICNRLDQHKKTMLFDRFWCFGRIPKMYVDQVEGYYINKLKPPFNRKIPPAGVMEKFLQ